MQDKKKKPGLFSCVKEAGPLARKAGFLARSIFALYTKFFSQNLIFLHLCQTEGQIRTDSP
ncbi:MAG: hypothetical protein DRI57_17635 [Deltaproteobacteria bacterium]|nr:MAG: hypothetical protein DRI57_17635 [Deltaproteobacteria bacterium]